MKNWFKKTFSNIGGEAIKNELKKIFSAYVSPWLSPITNWLQSHVMHILVTILVGMIGCLLALGFGIDDDMTPISILGTKTKKEALESIALGIGGVVATIVAAAVNRRATALEKSNDNEQFKSAMENLGHKDASVRIAAVYLFNNLAKEARKDVRRNIFEILCSRLRSMPRDTSHLMEKDEQERPRAECQTLLDILFQSEGESVFGEFHANLGKTFLMYADLTDTNLVGAKFFGANLAAAFFENANASNSFFSHAILIKANFKSANLTGTEFKEADLEAANLDGANFTNADLMGADLTDARVENANFTNVSFIAAHLKNVDWSRVHSIEGANFLWATIGDRDISHKDLPTNKGKYLASWADDEFWKQAEKNRKNEV